MFAATTILVTGTAPTTLYSPWMPRGGDYARVVVEVMLASWNGDELVLDFQPVHKNSDQTGNGSNASGGGTIGMDQLPAEHRFVYEVGAFKELVRFKVAVTHSGASSAETNWVTFRVHTFNWFDQVRP